MKGGKDYLNTIWAEHCDEQSMAGQMMMHMRKERDTKDMTATKQNA